MIFLCFFNGFCRVWVKENCNYMCFLVGLNYNCYEHMFILCLYVCHDFCKHSETKKIYIFEIYIYIYIWKTSHIKCFLCKQLYIKKGGCLGVKNSMCVNKNKNHAKALPKIKKIIQNEATKFTFPGIGKRT